MAIISITELDQLHEFDMSDDDLHTAHANGHLSSAEYEGLETAMHEAAHFCAAIIARSYIDVVCVTPPKRGKPSTGIVHSVALTDDPRLESFVSLAGYEWEVYHKGTGERGAEDFELAQDQARSGSHWISKQWAGKKADDIFDEAQQAARALVRHYDQTIRVAAIGIYTLRNKKSGCLSTGRILALKDWVRPQLPCNFNALFLMARAQTIA
jgi:hypothetical protein